MVDASTTKIVMTVKFRSRLPADEMRRRYQERMPEFRQLPGLVQKYYLYDATSDEWGGFYLWDSQESLDAYLASDLRKSIPETYQVVGTPRVETARVIDALRP